MQDQATYSPEDNKLRLYPVTRLDAETFARVKSAGFIWAPKQQLFVAPMWTPDRADLLLELCGEIDDEDRSLVERAEERAERFEDYSEARAEDAKRARDGVSAIADGIPLGQPILVGHHSERHARKDAERIENGMRKAVKMWETSKYWIARAKGAIRAAKYKERPEVRARRIKTIEADKRKRERQAVEVTSAINAWESIAAMEPGAQQDAAALRYAGGYVPGWGDFNLPKKEGDREDWSQSPSPYCALSGSYPTLYAPRTVAEIVAVAREVLPSKVVYLARCIEHAENRLAYERAMLDDQGASALLEKKPRPVQLPLCNYRAKAITYPNPWNRGEFSTVTQKEMTAAEYAKIHTDYKGTREVEHSHRVRTAFVWADGVRTIYAIFLTDSKVHKKPAPGEPPAPRPPRTLPASAYHLPTPSADDQAFAALKDAAAAGVAVVVAPQLFPTPAWLAAQVVERAEIKPGDRVLEPSAGTGNLLGAMGGRMFGEPDPRPYAERDQLHAVEINAKLCEVLRAEFPLTKIHCADFLSLNGELGQFDRIVMNPPFTMGADVDHVAHAWKHLREGGRLVAIMGGNTGRRSFVELLREIQKSGADVHIETLPAESFKDAGTSVNTVLLTVQKND